MPKKCSTLAIPEEWMSVATTRIKVFLSHSSVDKDLARRLARDLQAVNIDVWLDQWEIQVGEEFAQSIKKGVDDAAYVIVLLTPDSIASHWVDQEWRQKFEAEAKTKRIGIVPVRGKPCEIPDFLAQRSYADISGGSYPLGFRYLLEIISYYSDGADIKVPESISVGEEEADEEDLSLTMIPVVAPISLEVGQGLIPIFESDSQGRSFAMDELAPRMRNTLHADLGFPFPGIRVRGNEHDMPPYAALIMINEVPELIFAVDLDKVLVDATLESLADLGIPGEAIADPATGQSRNWIAAADRATAAAAGQTTWDAAEYIFLMLETLLRREAAEFLTIDVARRLVDAVDPTSPELVARTVPKAVSWFELSDILRRLIEEDIGVSDMALILEALSQCNSDVRDTVVLAEKARHALSKQITAKFTQDRDALPVLTLDSEIEDRMSDAIQHTRLGSYLALDPEVTQDILSAIRTQINSLNAKAVEPVILTSWEIRRYVRKMVELEFPWLYVLSRHDLEPNPPLQILAEIRLASSASGKTLTSGESAG